MRFPKLAAVGLLIAGAALTGGCGRNERVDVPADAVPPPALRPAAVVAPAPVALRPTR